MEMSGSLMVEVHTTRDDSSCSKESREQACLRRLFTQLEICCSMTNVAEYNRQAVGRAYSRLFAIT